MRLRRNVLLSLSLLSCLTAASAAPASAAAPLAEAQKLLLRASTAPTLAKAKAQVREAQALLVKVTAPAEAPVASAVRRSLAPARRAHTLADLRAALGEARGQLESWLAIQSLKVGATPSRSRLSDKFAEVLSRREYQHREALGGVMRWIARRLLRFLDWLSQHFHFSLNGAGAFMRVLAYVLGAAALVVGALLLANVLSGLIRQHRSRADRVAGPSSSEATTDPRRRRRQLLEAATAATEAGQFREAIRLLYQAFVLTLSLLHLVDWEPSRTNREYLAALESTDRRDVAGSFREATALFERKWYGGQAAELPEVRQLEAWLRSAEQEGAA